MVYFFLVHFGCLMSYASGYLTFLSWDAICSNDMYVIRALFFWGQICFGFFVRSFVRSFLFFYFLFDYFSVLFLVFLL